MKAMNSNTYNHDPISKNFLTVGLFISFSSLNKSDLDSKYIKMMDMNEASGNAAI